MAEAMTTFGTVRETTMGEMKTIARALPFALVLAGCAAPAAETDVVTPGETAATYTNPVLDTDFPDPTVIRASDGMFYAYATQTEREGRMLNVQVARSADLVRWETLGDALPVKPAWARQTQDFWAPHVAEHDGTFYLYYSAKPDAALSDSTRGLCLAVATATRPEGPFTDRGQPLQCGPGFVNIDPMSFDDPATGKRLLYWGSGFEPIKVQELAADRVSFAAGSRPIDLVHVEPDSVGYQRLVEGAWVIQRDGWYYLFYSGDNCCGPRARYAALVARSRSATGPFETLAQATGARTSAILEADGHWYAPGHNSVITDAAGDDWIVYHAVDVRRPRSRGTDDVNTRRVMLIDRLEYVGGWPRVVRGPSSNARPAPVVR
jgi:arabinan endo-1,5-alpha-L-arabinosidase